MKRLFTATTMFDGANVEMLKGLLEEVDIPCMIRNENLSSTMGEIPLAECSPELWILNDEDYPTAREIVETWRNSSTETHDPWFCTHCSEEIEGQFTCCWKCGREQPTA